MLVCSGCGGRNLPDLQVCPFCNRRIGAPANRSRLLRPRRLAGIFLATVLLVLFVGAVVLVLARAA